MRNGRKKGRRGLLFLVGVISSSEKKKKGGRRKRYSFLNAEPKGKKRGKKGKKLVPCHH